MKGQITEVFPSETTQSPLPPILLDAFQRGRVFDTDGKEVALGSNVSLEEATVLYRAVRHLKPKTSVEVGFGQGISTLAILQAIHDSGTGKHHVIDPYQEKFADVGLAMTKIAGLSHHMEFHRKFADEVIPALPTLDFAFIDSSHLFDLTVAEFVMVDRKLRIGGLVGFHDMWMASQQEFIRYVLSNRSYELAREFDSSIPETRKTFRRKVKHGLLKAIRLVPFRERIFREDLLKPFELLQIPNLVLLRKTSSDLREWTFHRSF